MRKLRTMAAIAALASASIPAVPPDASADPGHGLGFGQGIGGGRDHRGAPAPLLAAGVPAFAAIGAAAALRRLIRGRRQRPPRA